MCACVAWLFDVLTFCLNLLVPEPFVCLSKTIKEAWTAVCAYGLHRMLLHVGCSMCLPMMLAGFADGGGLCMYRMLHRMCGGVVARGAVCLTHRVMHAGLLS